MMMMNRTKSAVVDDLLKLKFKGIPTSTRSFSISHFPALESAPSLAYLIHSKPCSSDFDYISRHIAYKKQTMNRMDVAKSSKNILNLDRIFKPKQIQKDPQPCVDEFTHLLEIVTQRNHDDFFKQNRVPFVTSCLNTLIFKDRIHEAYTLLDKLTKQKLCEPTTLMYNTVIKALSNNPDKTMIDVAVKLFQEMVSQPDTVTYNSLVSGLCKMRCWTKATLLLKEMLDKDISPDVETFNVLSNTFCIEGRIQVACNVIDMMRARGISPNVATYNPIIDAHCLMGEMDEARSLFNLMVSTHVAPDTTTYNSLLIGYCDDEKMDDAMLNDAMLVYHEMKEKGFEPNWVTYNIMIQSCFKATRFADAHTLLDELFAQGQTLGQETYSNILHDLFSDYRFEEAFSLFHLLGADSTLNSNSNVVHDLMRGAIRGGKLEFARELFEGLSVKRLEPTSRIYTVMICGFCADGLPNDAKKLFLEMEENFCLPTDHTYNFLLQGYLRNKCYDDVEMLLHKMEEQNHHLYDSTLSLLCESVAAGSLDTSILELMNDLPRWEGVYFLDFVSRQQSLDAP